MFRAIALCYLTAFASGEIDAFREFAEEESRSVGQQPPSAQKIENLIKFLEEIEEEINKGIFLQEANNEEAGARLEEVAATWNKGLDDEDIDEDHKKSDQEGKMKKFVNFNEDHKKSDQEGKMKKQFVFFNEDDKMPSYSMEEKLKILLIALGDGERDLEGAKQRLTNNIDFELHSAFERVDRDASGWVILKELVDFLRENAVYHVSDFDAFELIKFFDSDGNSKLSFQEFIQMILPSEDNVLLFGNFATDRPSIRVGRFERLPREIELGLTAVIEKEVELARRLDKLKRGVQLDVAYSTMTSFRSVDRLNSGQISTVNLGDFMRDHGHDASENELLAIVRRLDTDGDAAVTYVEWAEFLQLSSAD